MIIEIDFNSEEAIYIQLCNQIVMGIATTKLRPGDSLPSVRQMADMLGVNMHTVNKAYSILKQDGYLSLDRRRGAVVSVSTREKLMEMQEFQRRLQIMMAQAYCKDLTRDEMHRIVDYWYDQFE
ncbi:MAG: GntR family transcriptional regulator [Lachnospiraceae bacterium]|nr:GntR family transcriptional regulator [Lachnospiraceae bacterium]